MPTLLMFVCAKAVQARGLDGAVESGAIVGRSSAVHASRWTCAKVHGAL